MKLVLVYITSIIFFIFIFLFPTLIISQENSIKEELVSYPTYYFGDPNPLPAFIFNPKIYPYHKFQGYDFEKANKKFKIVKLENNWIEVQVFPEAGGKIWSAVDKSNGNEFYHNVTGGK